MIALAHHLAWPIGLAAVIGLASGMSVRPRAGKDGGMRRFMGPLTVAALAALALGAGAVALGLAPGRAGLRLEIGLVLSAVYAASCAVAALARLALARIKGASRRA